MPSASLRSPAHNNFLDANMCCRQGLDQVPFEGSSSSSQLLGFGGSQPPVALATDIQGSSSNAAPLQPPQLQLYQPPYTLLDFPGIAVSSDKAPGFLTAGASTYDFTYRQELLPSARSSLMTSPFFVPRGPLNHFDDLPPDLFDSADQVPPTSSPSSSRTISDHL